jgi:methylthioribose-1-phosphate isomerase
MVPVLQGHGKSAEIDYDKIAMSCDNLFKIGTHAQSVSLQKPQYPFVASAQLRRLDEVQPKYQKGVFEH